MGQVVKKTGIKREAGYLYYLDKKGDVARTKMARGKKKTTKKKTTKKPMRKKK